MELTRRNVILLGSAALAAARLPAWAAPGEPPASGPLSAEAMAELLKKSKVPGVSVAVVNAGKIEGAYGYGLARAGSTDAVTAETRFQAASLSKTVNALIVLKLAEAGKLKLDDPVNDHLKSWKLTGKNADAVTIRALLSHTGGTTVSGFNGYAQGKPLPALAAVLDGKPPANSPPIKATGKLGRFSYSGGGVTVLQQMVIDVTGEAYDAAAKRLVLAPLKMSSSHYHQPPSSAEAASLASGHDAKGKTLSGGFNVYPELAAAGLWTTPSDMALLVLAVMGSSNADSGAFLKPASVAEMLKPVDDNSALGTFINPRGRFYHNGVNHGFRAVYAGDPAKGKRNGFVIMSNGDNGEAMNNDLAGKIVKAYAW